MISKNARSALAFSCIGHSFSHLFTALYFVIVLSLEAAWALPYHQLIELWALGSLLFGLAALPAGWIGDRWSASGMMVVFFVGMGAASILCGLTDSPAALMTWLAVMGLFSAIYHPVGVPWLIRNADQDKVGKLIAINGIFGSLGVALASLSAGILIDLINWRAAFIVPGTVSVAVGLLMLWFEFTGRIDKGVGRESAPDKRGNLKRTLLAFVILLLAMFGGGLIYQATQASMPKLFDQRLGDILGDGTSGIGSLVAFIYGAGGFFQLLGGYLADRYPLRYVYIAAWAVMVPLLWLTSSIGGLPLIAVAIGMVMLNYGAFPAEDLLLARYTPADHHGLAFGLKFVLVFGAAPLTILLIAMVQELTGSFFWLYATLAGISALMVVFMIVLPEPHGGKAASHVR